MNALHVNNNMALSIVIPVLNEASNIPGLLKRIDDTLVKSKQKYEVIFIDDNSTDRTQEIVGELSKIYPLRYFLKQGEKGKAQSLIEGFHFAKHELLCMIDSDLQYPPEAIPLMLEKMRNGYDVVIGERSEIHSGIVRKTISRTFNYIFARVLHGMKFDVQSGLKIFRKEIIERISIKPFPWTFDMEFLLAAKDSGYKIGGVDIVFEKRTKGKSKVNLIMTSLQIGLSALLLKIKPAAIIPFHNSKKMSVGQGFHYKNIEFIHFSDLDYAESAVKTLLSYQKVMMFSVFAFILAGLLLNWKVTTIAIVAILTCLYFVDLLFNFLLIYRSFIKSPEIVVTNSEINKIKNWPKYTIFCPLYKEWAVIPQFVNAIEKMDYPKNKLEVQLLLEEDDKETLGHVKNMRLPKYFKVIVVPDSLPKTKPKACNYGLRLATGKYAVIYDAEDIPDVLQLKKAVVAFQKSPENTACIQAKLNYYNKNQNLLTRLFTAEYSLWFDLILTGLQSIQAPIPLGGTSNHFRVDKLREVKGWDSFNVTEDCDLGIRLVKNGYHTAIIDTVTLEEANSNFFNWINQRSRWIKGYMQTYLVHMRDPEKLFKNGMKSHFFTFQMVVGGKILSLFINPVMWFTTILYFTLRAAVGPTIEEFFPGPIFYMAVFSLIFGNFLYLYYYMIGCAKRHEYDLIKYVFLVPLYWIAMSFAAWKGLFQLIFNPHFWPKTIHGLHLEKSENALKTDFWQSLSFSNFLKNRFRLELSRKHFWGGIFILSNAVASFINFLFSAFLGRTLTLEDFALVSLINGLISLISIIFGALGLTITYKLGYLIGKFGDAVSINFWSLTRKRAIKVSIALTALWIMVSPFLLKYFNLENDIPLLLFSPILLVNLAAATDKGLLFAKFNFKALSLLTIGEPLIKLLVAFIFVSVGAKDFVYSSIPLAAVNAFLIGWFFVYKKKSTLATEEEKLSYVFPKKFFLGSLALGVSTIIFLNLDVILAKHYLDPKSAGLYALTSLIGKMIFFLGSLAAPFTIPFVSKNEGANIDSKKFLHLTILAMLILTVPAFIGVTAFGRYLLPFMFGEKALSILPFITPVAFGMVCFSVAKLISDYYLAKKYFSFSVIAVFLGIVQVAILEFYHSSIWVFVYTMSSIWTGYSIIAVILHFYSAKVKIVESNILDFLNLFEKIIVPEVRTEGKLRILIFNWRDTRHIWAGGAEVYIHELAKRWVSDGNTVTVFCGNSGKSPRNEIMSGVQVYRRGGFYMVYFWAFIYYMFKFKGRYDVIIDSENGIPFFTPLYAKERVFLLIHHVHQEVFRKNLRFPFSTIASFLEGKYMPYVYRNSEVITVSPSSKSEILKHNLTKKNPIIIHNGVDHNIYKPKKKSIIPSVVYVGRLQRYKSLHVFIEAAKIVLEKIPNVEFYIAGYGEDKTRLEKIVKSLGLETSIRFLGKVSDDTKISLLQNAWIFVNPSFIEGWGITTIEANACGTPAVASDVPGLRDSVDNLHTGFLVKYGDSERFAEKIELLLNDRKLIQTVSKESIKWSKKYSWDASSDKMLQILQNII